MSRNIDARAKDNVALGLAWLSLKSSGQHPARCNAARLTTPHGRNILKDTLRDCVLSSFAVSFSLCPPHVYLYSVEADQRICIKSCQTLLIHGCKHQGEQGPGPGRWPKKRILPVPISISRSAKLSLSAYGSCLHHLLAPSMRWLFLYHYSVQIQTCTYVYI